MSKIDKAFVLAAGLGQRMRPLTNDRPKPLLEVAGRTMLDRALDALEQAGVKDVVVNGHYLADQVEAAVRGRATPNITFSREDDLLDTGGGVKRMLSFFGRDPFFVLNADNVWSDGPVSALARLAQAWDDARMDVLLLVKPVSELPAWTGRADYYVPEGSDVPVFGKTSARPADHVFIGPRIVHPRIFDGEGRDSFSFLDLFLKAEAAGRLRVLRHDADWHHVGTPEEYAETNRILAGPAKRFQTAP